MLNHCMIIVATVEARNSLVVSGEPYVFLLLVKFYSDNCRNENRKLSLNVAKEATCFNKGDWSNDAC